MKLSERLDQLRRRHPKRSRYGQLYQPPLTTGKFTRVVMYTLLESDEGTHLIHEAVFNKAEGKTAKEWAAWFSRNFFGVYKGGVIPGVNIRTSKYWHVKRVIGWAAHVKHKPKNSAPPKRRHKAKRSRS